MKRWYQLHPPLLSRYKLCIYVYLNMPRALWPKNYWYIILTAALIASVRPCIWYTDDNDAADRMMSHHRLTIVMARVDGIACVNLSRKAHLQLRIRLLLSTTSDCSHTVTPEPVTRRSELGCDVTDGCSLPRVEPQISAPVTVTVTVTDCLLKHELQKSSHPSPVVSRLLHRSGTWSSKLFAWA